MNKTTLISVGTLIFTLLISHPASSAKMYKWVDKDGNVSYQDSPPPEGSVIIREEEIGTTATTQTTQAQPSESVTVYTVPDCEACEIVLLRLQNWNVPATEQSLQDREVQARILQLSDSLQAPTLFIGDEIISDLSSSNLSAMLRQAGYEIENSVAIDETNLDTEN